MIKRIAFASIATAFTVAVSVMSLAQTPVPGVAPAPEAPSTPVPGTPPAAEPANPDDCIKTAFDLAQAAEDKKLSDDKIEKVDELLTRMETHCDARQFTEAMAVGRDIRSLIEQQ